MVSGECLGGGASALNADFGHRNTLASSRVDGDQKSPTGSFWRYGWQYGVGV